MGLFNFSKKKDEKNDLPQRDEIKLVALTAIELAIREIESTNSFLPFGGVITTENALQMVVYHDPSKTTIDHREHATIIQKLIQEQYPNPKNIIFFMAWDGIAHLPTGDIDCINVKVDHKFLNIHRIFNFTYKLVNGKVELQNINNPMTQDL